MRRLYDAILMKKQAGRSFFRLSCILVYTKARKKGEMCRLYDAILMKKQAGRSFFRLPCILVYTKARKKGEMRRFFIKIRVFWQKLPLLHYSTEPELSKVVPDR